jgi:hypothetical protein
VASAQSNCYRINVGLVLPTQLLAPNQDRDLIVIYNEVGTLFVKLGKDASASNYTFQLTSGSTLEIPAYVGFVTAVKQDAPGWVVCSEIT